MAEADTLAALVAQVQTLTAQVQASSDAQAQLQQQLAQAGQLMQAVQDQALAAEADRRTTLEMMRRVISSGPGGGGVPGDTGMVDTRGVGQPWKFNGKDDQDFGEWAHKFVTFAKAKFGPDIEQILN